MKTAFISLATLLVLAAACSGSSGWTEDDTNEGMADCFAHRVFTYSQCRCLVAEFEKLFPSRSDMEKAKLDDYKDEINKATDRCTQ